MGDPANHTTPRVPISPDDKYYNYCNTRLVSTVIPWECDHDDFVWRISQNPIWPNRGELQYQRYRDAAWFITPSGIVIITMPLVGVGHSLSLVGDEAPCFTSLEELDSWMDKPSGKFRSVLPYTPRSKTASPPEEGELLVCPANITLE